MRSFGPVLFCVAAAAACALAVEPYVAVKVCQPWDQDVRATYRALPEAEIGIRSFRSQSFALVAGVSGRYADGVGDFAPFRYWDVTGRVGLELVLDRKLGIYVAPGVLYKFALERWPEHDEEHNITTRDYGGGEIGFFTRAGVTLLHSRRLHLDFQAGAEFVSVQTDRMLDPEWYHEYGYYYKLPLSGFDIGLVLGIGGRE